MLAALQGPGVYRSTDGGAHWVKSTFGILGENIHILAADIAGKLYAGTEHGMLFRSADDGNTWDSLYNVSCPIRQILISGQKVYFGTWGTGVRISTDGGNSFSSSSITSSVGVLINAMAGNPSTGTLFVGTAYGVHRTTNDGALWERVNNGLSDSSVTALFVTPTGRLYCGVVGGLVFTSSDNGTSWTEADSGLNGSYIWCFAQAMNKVFVGTGLGVYSTADSGHYWESSGLGSSSILALATAKNGHLFAGDFQGPHRSTDGGATWARLGDGFVGNSARAIGVGADGYAFVATDGNGIYRSTQKVVTSLSGQTDRVPAAFKLEQNYPNPFNPLTIIKYTVGGTRGLGLGASGVTLAVYDVLGRQVAVLVNERKAPGSYEVSFDGSGLASGVYVYRLTARQTDGGQARQTDGGQPGSFVAVRRMVLVK
jgi:ligand-binding sensor domain-containing protein